jgi:hypothetical protein
MVARVGTVLITFGWQMPELCGKDGCNKCAQASSAYDDHNPSMHEVGSEQTQVLRIDEIP